ncbi:hypothetical protein F4680DRAFT_28096 [Xylaria scruposa]|nr:hypothetical protein F4680DRAFT_28096 [Xylaria scruposa]
MQRRIWANGPSIQAIFVVYHFSVLVLYIVNLALMAIKEHWKTFNTDLFPPHPNQIIYPFVRLTSLLFIALAGVSIWWARSLYRKHPYRSQSYQYRPPVEGDNEPR